MRRVNKITADLLILTSYDDVLAWKVYNRLSKKRLRLRDELRNINIIYKNKLDKL